MPESRTHTSVTGLAGSVLAQGVGGSHTGDTNETILATIPVSAGAMGANGLIVVRVKWTKTGTAGNITPQLRFGLSGAGLSGTSLYSQSIGAPNLGADQLLSLANVGATNSQLGNQTSNAGGLGSTTNAVATAAIDTTQATEVVFSAALGNGGDTITLAFYQAILYPHA